jgi:hypothetical protein
MELSSRVFSAEIKMEFPEPCFKKVRGWPLEFKNIY